jgi:hypothetical protein
VVVLATAWLFPMRGAAAQGLSVSEAEKLAGGGTVVRAQSLDRGPRHYVGGVAYILIDAEPTEVTRLFDDVGTWQRVLPKTRSARRVAHAADDALVEMTHGNAWVQATYTMRVHRDADGIRFWMDPRRRHDIEDAWGFMRVEPFGDGRTLVTYGILVDMGPSLLRGLFEERVRTLALSVPDRVRDLILERIAAGRRASY